MEAFPTVKGKSGDVPSPERSSEEKSSESAKHHKTPPRTSTLCTVIESLENRAMLAGLGQDSLSGLGSITAVLLPGVSSPPGIVLTGGSPTLGSTAGTGGSQSTGPMLFCGTGSGTGSSSGGSSSSDPNGPVLLGGSGSGTGSSSSGSSSSAPNGPVLSSQYTGGSNTGGQGTGTSNSGTLSGSDLWLLYGAGLAASSSSSGTGGGSSSNRSPLLTQDTEGSSASGQGNGTVGTLSNAELWRLYWSGAGAGSSSGPANGSLANDPTISAKCTGGSGGGLVFFVTGATGADAASSGSQQRTTGSTTLTLADGQSPLMTTLLVYQPGSDDGPGVVSGVWTGGDGGWQVVLAADGESGQSVQPMTVGDPDKINPTNDFEIIISGSGPNSQVFVPFNVIAQTPAIRGGPATDDVGTGSELRRSAQGAAASVGAQAAQDAAARTAYNQGKLLLEGASKGDPVASAARTALKIESRAVSSMTGAAIAEIIRPIANEAARVGGTASKGNAGVDAAMRAAGKAGPAILVVGAGLSAYNIATAENTSRAIAQEGGAWAGGLALGSAGGSLGAQGGAAIGVWFGGFGAVPGAVIGGAVGAIGGGIVGALGGEKLATTVYDGLY